MAESPTISPAAPDNHGLDYVWLKEEGMRLVQQLAGDIWTDYNEHDPGVTTLEQLCYALTDLSYRAEFPLRDLLADRQGRIDARRQALFGPRRILPCNPVTPNDYRRLLVDRVAGVANAWLRPRCSSSDHGAAGLYDILLYAPGADPCACDPDFDPKTIRDRTKRVYCRYRNLCEDVNSIVILTPLTIGVIADVTIDASGAVETILAALLFNLGNFLAPELRRQPLESLVALGLSTDAIFNGPLLRHGFISDEQLQPIAAKIPVASIVRIMARTPGVIGLRNVSVQMDDGTPPYTDNASIPVPDKHILLIDTGPDDDGFSIRLRRKGIEIKPDPARVKRELNRLWNDYRRTYPLTPQYQQFFALPGGRYRDLTTYYSLQNQYPNVYGINAYGLESDASAARKAQAKQLKGYLLVFEQLLADFFAQLARVRDLYSTERDLKQTYFYRDLTDSVPNANPLLGPDYCSNLARIVESQDTVVDRRNRFLDFLLALYGEKLDQSMLAERGGRASQQTAGERLLRAKLALLRHLVASTRDRGRGFDYLAPASPHNVAGMLIKSRIQLGMEPFDSGPRADILAELGLQLVESDAAATIGRPVSGYTDQIEDNFIVPEPGEPVPTAPTHIAGASPLHGQRVTEDFLQAAATIENFRIGSLPGENNVVVVCWSGNDSQWHFVGRYPDQDSARAAVLLLTGQASRLNGQQLYIIENSLLRFGHEADAGCGPREAAPHVLSPDFAYDFTITAVLVAPEKLAGDPAYCSWVREVIRANTPAHIAVEYCFLKTGQMGDFEKRYGAWRDALRRGDPPEIASQPADLRRFLQDMRKRLETYTPTEQSERRR